MPVINASYLTAWLAAVHAQWPAARMLTHGEFGLAWRAAHASNDYNYSFVEIGSGVAGSDVDKEISFFSQNAFESRACKVAYFGLSTKKKAITETHIQIFKNSRKSNC